MCIWERSARGSSVSVHVHWTLTIVQGNCAGSQLCKESCETEADNTIFVIQLCATNPPMCNKITLCKSHRATQLCECTTTDYVTVTFSDQATVLPLLPSPPPILPKLPTITCFSASSGGLVLGEIGNLFSPWNTSQNLVIQIRFTH